MIRKRRRKLHRHIRSAVLIGLSAVLIGTGIVALWVSTLKMPDLNAFENRRVSESTKIYDRTGEILLYDVNTDVKRTVVPLEEISENIRKAAIAIEDGDFYDHRGIKPRSILRAVIVNLFSGSSQGGSTITQQVVKNSLLTQDKTITRKIKEWVLAIKLERVVSKDQILESYLNENSYGGTIYGVEEASQSFYGKPASEVTVAEAAYLAAIPQRPTYYSPYGTHREDLDGRQKLVLERMRVLGLLDDTEYDEALKEKVEFRPRNTAGIKAPHFVMMVKDYLAQKYGEEAVEGGGLRVVTTLNYEMQKKAEEIITKFGPTLNNNFHASNTAMVAIDPKTGDILALVGSRDYFDPSIDGNYNIALAKRQPGSTFKPFVYATAFEEGYTPETVLFDVRTEFSTRCTVDGRPRNPSDDPEKVCYSPDEYDNIFEGPLTIRRALAQSRNIPAVKALYLAGINNSIETARDMGITTLSDPARYGLTLVLGGGEVSLLDLTSAYGVFANDGLRNAYRMVLEIRDNKGNVLESNGALTRSTIALEPDIARQISDILSDNSVRMNSLKPIAESVGRQVAIKTGTTNDFRDVWTVGYTPNLVVGAWAGKNDNTPMQHNVAGLIITPVWGAFMSEAVKGFPVENFKAPPLPSLEGKPVLRGIWQGGVSYFRDKISGKVATEYTPIEAREEVILPGVHTILHWVNKDDPHGPVPANPAADSQYEYWEYGVRNWFAGWQRQNPQFQETVSAVIPVETDDVHTADSVPKLSIDFPDDQTAVSPEKTMNVRLNLVGRFPATRTELYVNGKYILTNETTPLNISFIPSDAGNLSDTNSLSVIVYDQALNKSQATLVFKVAE